MENKLGPIGRDDTSKIYIIFRHIGHCNLCLQLVSKEKREVNTSNRNIQGQIHPWSNSSETSEVIPWMTLTHKNK